DALAGGGSRIGKHRLAPGGAVDHAADARPAAHFVDACVVGETAPDRLLAAKLRDPVRVGDESAAERDEVRLSCRYGLGCDRGIAEAADSDYWDADRFFDRSREIEKGGVRKGHWRKHDLS